MTPKGEQQRTTIKECMQEFLKFKRKLIFLTWLHISKTILISVPFISRYLFGIVLLNANWHQSHGHFVSALGLGILFFTFCYFFLSISQLSSLIKFILRGHPSSMLLPPDIARKANIFFFTIEFQRFLLFDEEEAVRPSVDQEEECQEMEEETSIEMQPITSTETCPEANGLSTSGTSVVVDCPSAGKRAKSCCSSKSTGCFTNFLLTLYLGLLYAGLLFAVFQIINLILRPILA
jgi:hypothetical protein